jgi:hypothetical protein
VWVPAAVFATWSEIQGLLLPETLCERVATAQSCLPPLRTAAPYCDCVVIPFGLPLADAAPLIVKDQTGHAPLLHFPSPVLLDTREPPRIVNFFESDIDKLLPAGTTDDLLRNVKNYHAYVTCLLNAEYSAAAGSGKGKSNAMRRAYEEEAKAAGYVPTALTLRRLNAKLRAQKSRSNMPKERKEAVTKYQKAYYKKEVKPAYDPVCEAEKNRKSKRFKNALLRRGKNISIGFEGAVI